MHKIRPTRILGGFTKAAKSAITGSDKEFVKQRKKYCFKPCEHNKGGTCNLCGCFLLAKTQEELEYCPINKWEDIKFLEEKGIALRNLSPEKVDIDVISDSQFEVTYREGISEKTDTTVDIEIINDRANIEKDVKLNLSNLKIVTSCGCTTTTTPPTELKDGNSFTIGLSYKRGTKPVGNFGQTIAFKSSEENFYIRLKGIRI